MSGFVAVWTKIEALELKSPLAQLGSYLRSQQNTETFCDAEASRFGRLRLPRSKQGAGKTGKHHDIRLY